MSQPSSWLLNHEVLMLLRPYLHQQLHPLLATCKETRAFFSSAVTKISAPSILSTVELQARFPHLQELTLEPEADKVVLFMGCRAR